MEFSSNRLKQVHSSWKMFFQRNVTIYGSNAPIGETLARTIASILAHTTLATIEVTALSGSLSLH